MQNIEKDSLTELITILEDANGQDTPSNTNNDAATGPNGENITLGQENSYKQ